MLEQRDRKDLKIQALLEKVTSMTTTYENDAADLRVELTILSTQVDALSEQLRNAHEELGELRNTGDVAETDEDTTTDDSD